MATTNSSPGVTRDLSPTASPNDFDDMASSGKLKVFTDRYMIMCMSYEQTGENIFLFSLSLTHPLYFLYLYFLFSCPLWRLYGKENVRSNEGRRTQTYTYIVD
jgi:hypothetical protein